MEAKPGYYYVRHRWNKTYHYIKVRWNGRQYEYLKDFADPQQLERSMIDNLEEYDVIKELPADYEPEFSNAQNTITATNEFGHQMSFTARNAVIIRRTFERFPGLAKALHIRSKK